MYVLYWVHFPTTCLESTCPQLNSLNTHKSMVKRPVGWPNIGHQCCSALVFQVQQEDLVSPQYSGRSYVWVPWVHGRRLLHQNSITLEVAYTKDLPFFVWNEKNKHPGISVISVAFHNSASSPECDSFKPPLGICDLRWNPDQQSKEVNLSSLLT